MFRNNSEHTKPPGTAADRGATDTDTTTHRDATDIDTRPQHTVALNRTRQWALPTPPPGVEAPGTASLTGSK